MQISRCVLMACVTATALLPLVSPAKDTEAQIKARQALEQKLKELQGQTAVPAQPPAAPASTQAAQPPAAAPAPKQPPTAPAPPVAAAAPKAAPPANDAQTKALQDALNQKMNELQKQPPAAIAPAAVATQPPGQPAPISAPPVAATPVKVEQPATDAQTKALQDALNMKMNELQVQSTATLAPAAVPTAAPAAIPAAAPAAAPAAMAHQAAQTSTGAEPLTFQNIPLTASSTADTLALQQALQRETEESHQAAIQAAVQEAQANQQLAAAQMHPPGQPTITRRTPLSKLQAGLPPLPTPPPAVSAAKEQQLNALLQQYMADQITPEQYHEQRAKILAQP